MELLSCLQGNKSKTLDVNTLPLMKINQMLWVINRDKQVTCSATSKLPVTTGGTEQAATRGAFHTKATPGVPSQFSRRSKQKYNIAHCYFADAMLHSCNSGSSHPTCNHWMIWLECCIRHRHEASCSAERSMLKKCAVIYIIKERKQIKLTIAKTHEHKGVGMGGRWGRVY